MKVILQHIHFTVQKKYTSSKSSYTQAKDYCLYEPSNEGQMHISLVISAIYSK